MLISELIAKLQEQLDISREEGRAEHEVLVCATPNEGGNWSTELEIEFAADACGGGRDFIILRWK